jgi:ribosome-associated heat shock protein Hsp15
MVSNYIEDITAPEQLEILELARFAAQSGRDRGAGRPTKKDRREIEQFFSDDYNYLLDEDYDFEEE